MNARRFWIELTPIAPLPCDRDVTIIDNLATGRQVKIEHHPGMTLVEGSITDPDLLVEMRWAGVGAGAIGGLIRCSGGWRGAV